MNMLKKLLSTGLALVMMLGLAVPVFAAEDDETQLYQGAEVYDHVLDIYDDDYQSSVRFKDGITDLTGNEWYKDMETVGVNRERAHTQFVPYQDAETALAAEKSVLDSVGRDQSKYYQLLSGKDWDFALVKTPAEAETVDSAYLAASYTGDAFQPEYVPQAWQTYRNEDGTFKYDEPMYTNQIFPWQQWETIDYNDPKAPTVYNPVGYYRTSFVTPTDWDGREIFISFQSVESAYYLYVNGKPVGYSTDSFTAHDFDITPYLNGKGETNTIALKVFRWSIASWLENQDFIRESGIYRDVYLYSKDEVELRDIFVQTAFADRTSVDSDVNMTVSTAVRGLHNAAAGDYTVSAYLVDDTDATVATAQDQTVKIAASGDKTLAEKLLDAGTAVTSTMTVTNPAKWFPDTPNLYRVVIQLKKGDQVMETAVQRVGFREIYKVDIDDAGHEQMQITGKQIVFRGVNRHDSDLETGHAVTEQDITDDLMLMKAYNLNAIRTSHYSNDQLLYDLADELGLYICAEANVESHAGAYSGLDIPTGASGSNGLPEWVPSVLDRTATMLERYKNHTSIVIWSLGNEATYTSPNLTSEYCFWVSSCYLLKRDPSRIRKYERESYRTYTKETGADPWDTDVRKNNIVDVYSTQYALPSGVAAYNGKMPYIHSEYDHSMGQAYGDAKEHWEVIRERDNVQGGFIWDWIDQSIETTRVLDDGTTVTFWGYGGDWIDTKRNDNAFCGNGLVYADRTASPKLAEAKKVHQQVNFYQEGAATPGGKVAVKVVNELENTALDAFEITWTLTEDGQTVLGSGKLDLATAPMQNGAIGTEETVEIPLPAFTPVEGRDYLLDFSVTRKADTAWAKAGEEIAYEQFQLSFANEKPQDAMDTKDVPDFTSVTEDGEEMTLTGTTDAGQKFSIILNTRLGTIERYSLDGKTVMRSGPEQSYWRAQTYNDSSVASIPNLVNAGNAINMKNIKVTVDKGANKLTLTMDSSLKVDAKTSMVYDIYGNGEIVVSDQFLPNSDFAPNGLPKIGTRMVISGDYDNITYYGRGPQETYVDRKSGARVGLYTSTVDQQFESKMLRPQENGNRTDVRWTSLTNDDGVGLLVSAEDVIETSALHYTAEELNSGTYNSPVNAHPYEVPQRSDVVWSIDLHQNGVSDTAFMGHKPLDGYRFATDRSYSYTYRISPVGAATDRMAVSNESFTISKSQNPVTGIYVNGNPVPGFSVDTYDYTYSLSATDSGAVVTATGINTTVTMNEDGTATVSAVNSSGKELVYTVQLTRDAVNVLPVSAFSQAKTENSYTGQDASKIIDGDTSTIWHSNWATTVPFENLWFMVELKEPTVINGIQYLPRSDGRNGAYGEHEVYVSEKSLAELDTTEPVQTEPMEVDAAQPATQTTDDAALETVAVATGDETATVQDDATTAAVAPDGDGVAATSLTDDDSWELVGKNTWPATMGWKTTMLDGAVMAKTIWIKPVSTYGDTANAFASCAEFRVTTATDASNAEVVFDASYPFTGTALRPDPTVKVDGLQLVRGVDYDVTYENNDKLGTATAKVTFKGSFYTAEPIVKTFALVEAPSYTLTVTGGTATVDGKPVTTAQAGETVTITATVPSGQRFGGWTTEDVTLADKASATTTFTMPEKNVTVAASFQSAYTVTVTGGVATVDGKAATTAYAGDTVTITATVPSGQRFVGWTTSDVTLISSASATTSFTMPEKNVTVTASFQSTSSGGSTGGGSSPATYAVSVTTATGGKVTANRTTAPSGTKVTLTVAPDEGYQLSELKVTDKNNNELTVTKSSDTTYTYIQPSGAVTVTPTFTKTASTGLPFTDIGANPWYEKELTWAYQNNIINGTSATTFSPDTATTRGMIVTILYRLSGETTTSTASFSDVASTSAYAQGIAWGKANGIATGFADGTFKPNQAITRQQMAAFLYRYAQKYSTVTTSATDNLAAFTDAAGVAAYAKDAMNWAVGQAILQGNGGKLMPTNPATRAQSVVMLSRFNDLLGK